MNGSAYYKALRAHYLVDAALHKLMLNGIDDIPTTPEGMKIIYDNLQQVSRTAKLWVLYHNMACLIRQFIYAERLHQWDDHQESVYLKLPYFAPSGHGNYAKSGCLYLQHVADMKEKHPDLEKNSK